MSREIPASEARARDEHFKATVARFKGDSDALVEAVATHYLSVQMSCTALRELVKHKRMCDRAGVDTSASKQATRCIMEQIVREHVAEFGVEPWFAIFLKAENT